MIEFSQKYKIFNVRSVIILTILVYSVILPNGFVADDHVYVEHWPLIENLHNFRDFFGPANQPPGGGGIYSPLKTFFHCLAYHLWGLNPLGYHLFSLFLHSLGTILVYKIIMLLVRDFQLALLTSLFFGLHPVHVEAIAPATQSVDSIGNIFLLASFYEYIQLSEDKNFFVKRRILSILWAVMAIFTYELTIVLPLLLFLYEMVLNRSRLRVVDIYYKIGPYLLISFLYIGIKFLVLDNIARGGYLYDSFYLTMLVVIKALALYVMIFVFPIQLSANHEISPGIFSVDSTYFDRHAVLSQSFWDVQSLVSVVLILFIFYMMIKLREKQPVFSFGLGFFFVSLLPTMNIVPTGTYFAERYMYVGSLGGCLVLSNFFITLLRSSQRILKYTGMGLIIIIPIFYFIRTSWRGLDLRNDLTGYEAEVKVNPRHPNLWRNLGIAYLQENEPETALPFLQKALLLRPNDPKYMFSIADAYMDLKNYKQALFWLSQAIEKDPEYADAFYNRAGIDAHLGLDQEARENLNKALYYYRQQGENDRARQYEDAFYNYFTDMRPSTQSR